MRNTEDNCKQVLAKLGDRKKRIEAGLKQDAKVCCQMLKFLMFAVGFLERRGTPAESQRPMVTGESEFSRIVTPGNFQICSWYLLLVIFLVTLAAINAVAFVKLC